MSAPVPPKKPPPHEKASVYSLRNHSVMQEYFSDHIRSRYDLSSPPVWIRDPTLHETRSIPRVVQTETETNSVVHLPTFKQVGNYSLQHACAFFGHPEYRALVKDPKSSSRFGHKKWGEESCSGFLDLSRVYNLHPIYPRVYRPATATASRTHTYASSVSEGMMNRRNRVSCRSASSTRPSHGAPHPTGSHVDDMGGGVGPTRIAVSDVLVLGRAHSRNSKAAGKVDRLDAHSPDEVDQNSAESSQKEGEGTRCAPPVCVGSLPQKKVHPPVGSAPRNSGVGHTKAYRRQHPKIDSLNSDHHTRLEILLFERRLRIRNQNQN